MSSLTFKQRVQILIGLLCLGIAIVLMIEPFAQDPRYHLFVDTRSFLGVPNFNDVFSNIGFAVVGILGIHSVARIRRDDDFQKPPDARPFFVFFIGVALVSLGSGYYHLAPSNERLLWDRLPMSIAFMAFCSLIIADRIDSRSGNGWLLAVLGAVGCVSVAYWSWTESQGRGDLRFYALIQFYPVLVLPLVCGLFPRHRYTAGRGIAWVFAWYGLSKLLEHADSWVFDVLGQTVSGHSLKHLAAAVATFVVLRMLMAGVSPPRSDGSNRSVLP